MTEPHIVSRLRTKRAEISDYIADLERKINHQRADLAHLDANIRLFSPETNPETIHPKRAYRRTRYFARNELSRLTSDALRLATGPFTVGEIVLAVMRAKELSADDQAMKALIANRVLSVLRGLLKRGSVIKSGTSRNAPWALPRTD